MLTPSAFRSFPCPTYPEIRVAVRCYAGVETAIRSFKPDHIHLATEGPLGLAGRRYCKRHSLRFTTSYHTHFPQYIRARVPIPQAVTFLALRWFHSGGERCMISTPAVRDELTARGFKNLAHWGRGVDTDLFHPREKAWLDLPRPVAAYVGRLAVEKNVDEFLSMPWAGSKIVIGDGPGREQLMAAYPSARFFGLLQGADLAKHLAAADVFVFPSRTDTFGLVMLEALACAIPVAAFPVTGPIDVIDEGVTGALDENLQSAALRALKIDPAACRRHALRFTWEICSREFEANLVFCHEPATVLSASAEPAGLRQDSAASNAARPAVAARS